MTHPGSRQGRQGDSWRIPPQWCPHGCWCELVAAAEEVAAWDAVLEEGEQAERETGLQQEEEEELEFEGDAGIATAAFPCVFKQLYLLLARQASPAQTRSSASHGGEVAAILFREVTLALQKRHAGLEDHSAYSPQSRPRWYGAARHPRQKEVLHEPERHSTRLRRKWP